MRKSILCALVQTAVCTSSKRGLNADYGDEFTPQRRRMEEDAIHGIDEDETLEYESGSAALLDPLPDLESAIRELTGYAAVEAVVPQDALIRRLHRVVLPTGHDVDARFYTVPAAPRIVSAVRGGIAHLLRSRFDFASLINPQSAEISEMADYFHSVAQRLHVPEIVFLRMIQVMEAGPAGVVDGARFRQLFGDVLEGYSEVEIARFIQWYYEHLFVSTTVGYKFEKIAGLIRPDRDHLKKWAKMEIDRLVQGPTNTWHLPYPHFVRRLFPLRINSRSLEYAPVSLAEVNEGKFRTVFPDASPGIVACMVHHIRPISYGDVTAIAGGIKGCGSSDRLAQMNKFVHIRFSVSDAEFEKFILYRANEDRENDPDIVSVATRVWFDILARTMGGSPRVADIPLYQLIEGGRVWPPLTVMKSIASSILREIWD